MIQQEDDIDAILDLMLQRMRMSKDFNKIEDNSVHEALDTVLKERRKKRNAEVGSSEEHAALLRSQQVSTKNSGVSVGTLLAAIPDILEDHGVSFGAISNHLYNFEKSLEGAVESGFAKVAETMKQTAHENAETLSHGLESIQQTMTKNGDTSSKGLVSIKESLDQNGQRMAEIGDTMHQGLHSIMEKMEHNAHLEDTLHSGLDLIAEKLADKSKIHDTIHDGLHEISEQIETVNTYGLSGLINTLDGHDHPISYPPGHGPSDGHTHYGSCKFELFYLSF